MATMIYFVVKDSDGDIYIEPRKSPARTEDVEVDGKEVLDYSLNRDTAAAKLKNRKELTA